MSPTLRVVISATLWIATAAQASAQTATKADPDWPCRQIKTTTYSLASVWAGPPLNLDDKTFRDDPKVADLAAMMSRRRVPTADVEKAIVAFDAQAGEAAKPRLLAAFAAAFNELSAERSQVIEGLDRFGRKQLDMADRIRAENEAVQKAADESGAQAPDADSLQRLQWDLRVYEDRRRTIGYVCDTPGLIEQRIGAIARAVQAAL